MKKYLSFLLNLMLLGGHLQAANLKQTPEETIKEQLKNIHLGRLRDFLGIKEEELRTQLLNSEPLACFTRIMGKYPGLSQSLQQALLQKFIDDVVVDWVQNLAITIVNGKLINNTSPSFRSSVMGTAYCFDDTVWKEITEQIVSDQIAKFAQARQEVEQEKARQERMRTEEARNVGNKNIESLEEGSDKEGSEDSLNKSYESEDSLMGTEEARNVGNKNIESLEEGSDKEGSEDSLGSSRRSSRYNSEE